jgi:hypothetical protein
MKEEETQGISTETTTKDSYNTNKTTENKKLLDLRAGYVQHTSTHQNPPSLCGTIPQFIMSETSNGRSNNPRT